MIDRATEYAKQVVNGGVICGELHKQSCQRHLNDLKRQRTEEFPFYYDPEAAQRIVDYAETLTIIEGTEPIPVKLIPSQVFDFSMLFGWKSSITDKRRFRRSYLSMARQNGKSFTNGILGTYIAGFSGYNYGKLFTVAVRKRQARIAWEEMSKFIKADSDLGELFDVKDYKNTIIAKNTGCEIMALSREAGLEDGHRSVFCSIDELHQHVDNSVYKALANGTRALPETLLSMITTRGKALNSFCYEMDKYAQDVVKGLSEAPDFFVDIYCLDKDDDIWDEKNWIKANPFLARDPLKLKTLRQEAETARDMGGMELSDFIVKSLNMWVQNTDDQFINVDKWQSCGSDRTLEDFRGRDCWVGLDLSSGGDLTTFALEFEDGDKYYFYSHSFMPRGRLEEHIETDLAPYDLWVNMELITVTGGSTEYKNDYGFIIKELQRLRDEYDLNFKGIGVDPHNFDGIRTELEAFGCPVLLIVQSCKSLNDATVDIQLLCKSEKLEYNKNNELLTWSFLNASVVRNSFDEIKVDKKPGARFKRIDPVDACIDAHACMLKNRTAEVVDVETELANYLEAMGWK